MREKISRAITDQIVKLPEAKLVHAEFSSGLAVFDLQPERVVNVLAVVRAFLPKGTIVGPFWAEEATSGDHLISWVTYEEENFLLRLTIHADSSELAVRLNPLRKI